MSNASEQIRKVFKYALPIANTSSQVTPLRLPAGAKILKIGHQGDHTGYPEIFIWALVDPSETLQELRYVVTAGTGHSIEMTALSAKDWECQETVLCMGGRLVVHVWISRADGKAATEVFVGDA